MNHAARTAGPDFLVVGLVLVLLLAVALCASVLAVGLRLSSPFPRHVGPAPAQLPGAEAVDMRSASGSVLRGWWVAGSRPSGGAVVLLHGIRADRLILVQRARVLQEHGFSVLLFDLQAHGESSGRRITFGKLEALDAAAAVDFVRHRVPGGRVGAIGCSLGGAAALLGPTPLDVNALVLESVFPDIDAALANRLRAGLGPLAGQLFTPLLVRAFKLLLPPILGARASELRPIDRIGVAVAPLLVASGTADRLTTLAETEALFERAPKPKRLWTVDGAAHVDLEQFNPERYWATVLPFLSAHLRTAAPSDD